MTVWPDIAPILDMFCPMHVQLAPSGHIVHVGPTLQKLRPDTPLAGQRFLEAFELQRPQGLHDMAGLMATAGRKLHLVFRDAPRTGLKGVLAPLPDGQGAVVDLSFGIGIVDAVRDYRLSSADFAATDLTIEMLYLVEAKSAAMQASRQLNLRLQGAKIAAEEQAFTDTLTGLKNRRALDHILDQLWASRAAYSLMHLDLDYFKAVNDTLGHAAGDFVLRQVAQIMQRETRDGDVIARVGGDEFVLVFEGPVPAETLTRIAERLISRIEAPLSFEGNAVEISASIGIVSVPYGTKLDIADVLQRADMALYASKHRGRGQASTYDASLGRPSGPMQAAE